MKSGGYLPVSNGNKVKVLVLPVGVGWCSCRFVCVSFLPLQFVRLLVRFVIVHVVRSFARSFATVRSFVVARSLSLGLFGQFVRFVRFSSLRSARFGSRDEPDDGGKGW